MNQPPVDFIRVEADAHREFGASCLEACGLEDAQAEHIAARLTWADLRGIHSHGAPLLERYVRDLRAGTVNPAPSVQVVCEEEAMIVVDGDGGYGYVPTASVTETIIGKARDRGVAAGSLQHIGHYGSASQYTSMCAEAGCIGFSVQGLVSGFDFPDLPIALWGSRPISFAIPAGDRPPIIVDGCANLFREQHLDLFERVPSAFFMSLGFTVVAKLLGDGLSGQMRRYTREADPAWPAAGIGAFVLAINVEHFTSASEFGGVVDRFVGEMCTQMRPMPGTHRALLPGMLEAERQQTYQREGIPLATETCRLLEEIARPLGVSVPWPALGAG
jgi:LDH2 family malate/lactate/ureidoglycolate dehydrogenase